jgi:hypothetical protein
MPRTVKLKAGRNEFFVAFPASAPGWTGQYSFIETGLFSGDQVHFFQYRAIVGTEDDGERHFPESVSFSLIRNSTLSREITNLRGWNPR